MSFGEQAQTFHPVPTAEAKRQHPAQMTGIGVVEQDVKTV